MVKYLDYSGLQILWNRIKLRTDPKQLTSENLLDLSEGEYWAADGNSCTNKPQNVTSFSLSVIKTGVNNKHLLLITGAHKAAVSNGDRYYRDLNKGTWSSWTKMPNAADKIVYNRGYTNQNIDGTISPDNLTTGTVTADKIVAGTAGDFITIADTNSDNNRTISSKNTLRFNPGGVGTIFEKGNIYTNAYEIHLQGSGTILSGQMKLTPTGFILSGGTDKQLYTRNGGYKTLGTDFLVKNSYTTLLPQADFILDFDSNYTSSISTTEKIKVSNIDYFRITSTSTEQNSIKVYVQGNLSISNDSYLTNTGAGNRGIIIRASNMMQNIVFEGTNAVICSKSSILSSMKTVNGHTFTIFKNVLIDDSTIFHVQRGGKLAKIYFTDGIDVPTKVTLGFNNDFPKIDIVRTNKQVGLVYSPTSGLSSYWAKLASISFKSCIVDIHIHSDHINLNNNLLFGTIRCSIYTSPPTSGNFKLDIINGNIPTEDVRLYQNVANDNNVIEIWVNCRTQWGRYQSEVIRKSNNINTTYNATNVTLNNITFTTVQTLPTYNYITATYATLKNPVENATNAINSSYLIPKTITSSDYLNSHPGCFVISDNNGYIKLNTDSVGIQIGDLADKFQLVTNDADLTFRQNDAGGTNSTNWTTWKRILDDSNYRTIIDNTHVTLNTTQTITGQKTFNLPILHPQTATWLNGMVNGSVINFPTAGYDSLAHWKTKNGHISISCHAANNDDIVFGYMTDAQVTGNNNNLSNKVSVNPNNGTVTANKFVVSGATSNKFLMGNGNLMDIGTLSSKIGNGFIEQMCIYIDGIDQETYIETYDGLNIVDLVYEQNNQKYHTAFMWLGSWIPSNIGSNGGNVIIFEKGIFNDISIYIPNSGENIGLTAESTYFRLQGSRLLAETNIISARQYTVSLSNLFN